MVILEEPYVSGLMADYLESNNIPVLANDFSKKMTDRSLNLVPAEDFIEGYRQNKKIYSVSEYALDWVISVLNDKDLNRQVGLMKNKAAFREAARALSPDFFFKEIAYSDLFSFDISGLRLPFVLKPSVGFLSAGVYTIFDKKDWDEALEDIAESFKTVSDNFPDVVVGNDSFIIESYIEGKEFALDLYFRNGKAVIVNIFEHPFSSGKDVSDRLYITGKEIFDRWLEPFTEYMNRLNKVLELDNIPVHVELRADGENIVPIEINPLRFAGMCLNEINYYISGNHPLHYYLTDTTPDYAAMWEGKDGVIYSFSIIEKPSKGKSDIESIKAIYSDILEWRLVENPRLGIEAFVFSRTKDQQELDRILNLKV